MKQETERYLDEEDSFAWLFNHLIDKLDQAKPPPHYHDSEDRLGEEVQRRLNWRIEKRDGIWVNQEGERLQPSDYLAMLEQGAFKAEGVGELVGRPPPAEFRRPSTADRFISTTWSDHTGWY